MITILPLAFVTFAHAQTCSGGGLCNPLNPAISSIPKFVEFLLKVMVQVALPVIALFIVYSGFMFIFARGNDEKLKIAKRNFMYVIIGTILILGAWVIATLLGNTVGQLLQ